MYVSLCFCAPSHAAEKKILYRPHRDPSTFQESAGGFWRTDRDFDAALRIKNVLLNQSLEVVPVIYMADGTEVELPRMTIPAAGVVSLDIGKMLQSRSLGAHVSSYGSASVRYKWSWAAVLATIQNTDEMESITFHSTLNTNITDLKDPAMPRSAHVLRGMWWSPHAVPSGFIALSNETAQSLKSTVILTSAGNQPLASKAVVIPSHATSLLAFQDLLGSVTDAESTGSVLVSYTGGAGSIVANAGIENRETGYSASPRISEVSSTDDASGPVELAAPGVMVGPPDPAMLFPTNTVFKPYAFLQNLTSAPLQVGILAANNGGSRLSLGAVTVPANGATKVDVAAMISQSKVDLWPESTNLLFSYTGRLGDLGVETGSTDQTNNYVFEVAVNAEVPTLSRTICYWTVSGDNDTMLDLWNYTNQASDEVLTLQFDGGNYKVPVHLPASGGMTLSIHKLQRQQVADVDGHRLPLYITEGSALLASAKGETERMSVAVSAASFNVRNATCGLSCTTCNGVTAFELDPGAFSVLVQQQGQMQGKATYNTGTTQMTTSGTWSSQTTSIASVGPSGMVAGVSPGQSTISFISSGLPPSAGTVCNGYAPSCPAPANFGGQGPAVVQTPDHIVVLSDMTQTLTCPNGYSQLERFVDYSVLSSSNQQVTALMSVFETVDPNTVSSCTNTKVGTTPSCTQITGGYLPDVFLAGCPGFSNPGCGFTYPSQSWNACLSGSNKNLGTIGQDIVHSNAISLGGNTTMFTKGTTFPH
jgi:hypothetical protein